MCSLYIVFPFCLATSIFEEHKEITTYKHTSHASNTRALKESETRTLLSLVDSTPMSVFKIPIYSTPTYSNESAKQKPIRVKILCCTTT